MAVDAADRAYKARALAQAHPLTPLAGRYRTRAVKQQEAEQPMTELARWAGEALLKGYCLRKVEEQDAGTAGGPNDDDADLDELDAQAALIAAELRTGDPAGFLLGDADLTFVALDRIINSEVTSRHDNYREHVDEASWAEFEEYIAWWTVQGYAFRIAEAALGADQ